MPLPQGFVAWCVVTLVTCAGGWKMMRMEPPKVREEGYHYWENLRKDVPKAPVRLLVQQIAEKRFVQCRREQELFGAALSWECAEMLAAFRESQGGPKDLSKVSPCSRYNTLLPKDQHCDPK